MTQAKKIASGEYIAHVVAVYPDGTEHPVTEFARSQPFKLEVRSGSIRPMEG